jgi:predicted enzyme related to lactoylglutathione lyase
VAEIDAYDEGTPCWIDLTTPDLAKATEFYKALFGWDYVDTGEAGGHYQLATLRGKVVAGIGPIMRAGTPSTWTTYLSADDVDSVVARIDRAGGKILLEPIDVMDKGRMAMVADPTDAVFGVWQPGKHRGAELCNEPSTCRWNELLTDDPDTARAFYEQVFGYTYEEDPDFPGYLIFKVNGRRRGGIGPKPQDMPAGTPNFWDAYIAVADTDESTATAISNGATVQVSPTDMHYGRFSVVKDPGGASVSLIMEPKS